MPRRVPPAARVGLLVLAALAWLAGAVIALPSHVAPLPATQGPVIVVGAPGLLWQDITPTATPHLWQLAERGSLASVAVRAVNPLTCPDDGWASLNAATRAVGGPENCAPGPADNVTTPAIAGGPATLPDFAAIRARNAHTGYKPTWGSLAATTGGRCANAVGPGAALALADPSGQVARYWPDPAQVDAAMLRGCPLTVIDAGAIGPYGPSTATTGTRLNHDAANVVTSAVALPATTSSLAVDARSDELSTLDARVAAIVAAAPSNATVIVAGVADTGTTPRLRALLLAGPRGAGLLHSASTRQTGLVQLSDVDPTLDVLLGRAVPHGAPGAALGSVDHDSGATASSVTSLRAQDTTARVDHDTVQTFLIVLTVLNVGVLVLLALWRRTRALAGRLAVLSGAVPVASFLAALLPWARVGHPALVLYGCTVLIAAAIGAIALRGPWRRDPCGPAGVLACVTLAVLAVDLTTGGHAQIGSPLGLSMVVAGRFYGMGNAALGPYLAATLVGLAWLAGHLPARRRAMLVCVLGLGAVLIAGLPGFGSKIGVVLALTPGVLVLTARAANIRLTVRRVALVAVSGVVVIVVLGIADYTLPGVPRTHLAGFVGQVLHGGAGDTLHRKIKANLHSLSGLFGPLAPVAALATLYALLRPERRGLAALRARDPLVWAALPTLWACAVLGWFVDDSGTAVFEDTLLLGMPLAVACAVGCQLATRQEAAAAPPDPAEPLDDAAAPDTRNR